MRTVDDLNLTPAQRAELESAGEAAADYFEALDPDAHPLVRIETPEGFEGNVVAWLALRDAERERERVLALADASVANAVARARAGRMSWRAIGEALGMSGENARRTYARAS